MCSYSNGVVRVRYPVSKGTRTAYAAMSGFFQNNEFSSNTMKLGTGKTAYRKSTGNATIGSVYASDDVVIVGQANGRTELIYPTSSGYKLGWGAGSYSISNSNELRAPATWAISEEQALTVLFQARYYANSYSDLKAAFGYDEKRLYEHYLTFGIREGRSASPISARYIKGTGNSNTGEYCCARYVSNYYKSVYGVTVANMFTGRTPSVSSGYFYQTNSPMAGDIGYQLNSGNSGHWFIIKAVNGDGSYTVIEQNWKWADNGRTYCYKNRKVYNSTKGFKVFRWSRR